MSEEISKDRAYEILGLEAEAPVEDVKRKYENLMRRAKFDESVDVDTLTRAYDAIMGYNWGNIKPDEAYTKKGLNKKKIENFFYHYKKKIIYGTIILAMIASVMIPVLKKGPQVDYGVVYLGNILIEDTLLLKSYVENRYGVQNVAVDYAHIQRSGGSDGTITQANIFRLMLILDDPKYGILFTEKNLAQFLLGENVFLDLSPYLDQLGLDPSDERILWQEYEGNLIAGAVYVNYDTGFSEYAIGTLPQCVSIARRAKDKEKAVELLKIIIETEQ